jgi:hypothetical protein
MEHFAFSATLPRIAPASDDARGSGERQRARHGRSTPILVLILHIVGVAALVAASVAAIADQSARFVSGQEIVGVHEVPSFISGRVELTPGVMPDDPTPDVGTGQGGRGGATDLSARRRMPEQG